MSHPFSSLSEADIRQLTQLIDSLERSAFDFLQVQVGDLKVTVGKGDPAMLAAPVATPPAAPAAAAPAAAPVAAASPPAAAAKPASAPAAEAGTIDITSPLLGVFYAQAEPGAPPFVTVGAEVREDTTVALVEVMKTFNAVPAGRRGMITEVCAQNAQLVEFGQVLFRLRPA
ncbi:MAG: acetyl-CoA carboxylase, biotin carboxyl carrier protein [Bradyrhizobiaceae bacterium]|nr:acetyl-CoA carboxylase, biotin carboxyl carrier protein [Bradyrhizobiaceae bacterium]